MNDIISMSIKIRITQMRVKDMGMSPEQKQEEVSGFGRGELRWTERIEKVEGQNKVVKIPSDYNNSMHMPFCLALHLSFSLIMCRADTGFHHAKPTERTPRLLLFHGQKACVEGWAFY